MAKSTEKQLRDEIYRVLKNVNLDNTPNVHASIQSEMGYKNIEAKIIELVLTDSLTPSACIPHIEREL